MPAVIVVAVVVGVAAVSKLRAGIAGFGAELSRLLGLPAPVAVATAVAVIVGEFSWVVLLFVEPVPTAAFSVAALVALTWVNAVSLRKGHQECLCFGPAVPSSPRSAVLRNSVLIVLAVAVLVAGPGVLVSPVIDVCLGIVLAAALIRIEDIVKAIRVVVIGAPTEAAS